MTRPDDQHSGGDPGADPGSDPEIAALYRARFSEDDEDPARAESRIDAALAAYDLAVRAQDRRTRRRTRFAGGHAIGTVAAATVLVVIGAAGGFVAGRGNDRSPAASDPVIGTTPIRGTTTDCEDPGGDDAGTVLVGDRKVTVRVVTRPTVRVTLIDAGTCEVIVSLP